MNDVLISIQEAAEFLGVSTKTLRRWEKRGILTPNRTAGNQRRYSKKEILSFKKPNLYSKRSDVSATKPEHDEIEQLTHNFIFQKSGFGTTPQLFEELSKFEKQHEAEISEHQVDSFEPQASQGLALEPQNKNSLASQGEAFKKLGKAGISIFVVVCMVLLVLTAPLVAGQFTEDLRTKAQQISSNFLRTRGLIEKKVELAKSSTGSVLAAATGPGPKISFNIPAIFKQDSIFQENILVDQNATISANLAVAGNTNLEGPTTIGSTLGVAGATTLSSTLTLGTGNTTFYSGTGVPDNSIGQNGDYFFRTDGTGSTAVYYKVSGAWTIAGGVTSIAAGTGISVSGSTGAVTISNTGVTSLTAGTDISVSGSSGSVTVNDTSTLATVTGRGATTTTALTLNGAVTMGSTLAVTGATTFTGASTFGSTTTMNGLTYTWPSTQTSGYVLSTDGSGTLSWVSSGGLGARWDLITSPAGNQTLAMANYATTWNWATGTSGNQLAATANSLTTGTLFDLSSTSTAGDGSKLLNLSRSGANAAASKTNYGLYSAITNTGTTSTNIAGYFSASGGTSNYAGIFENGNVGIGTTTPGAKLAIQSSTTSATDFSITNTGVYTGSGIFTLTANAATSGDIMTLSATALTSGSALTLTGPSTTGVSDHFVNITSDVQGASLLDLNSDFTGSHTSTAINNRATDTTSAGSNIDYLYYGELTISGNGPSEAYGIYNRIDSPSTLGSDLYYGIYNQIQLTGAVAASRDAFGIRSTILNSGANTAGTINTYGAYITASGGGSTGSTNNVYGNYLSAAGTLTTDGTINVYGSYIANGSTNTTGTSAKYGLYIVDQSGSDTNIDINFTASPILRIGDAGVLTFTEAGGNNTLCTITDNANVGDLNCTGNITGASTGTVGYWSRSGTTLSPATANDIVSIANTTTTGADFALTNTGAYTGTGIFNLTANSLTTGTAAAMTANALSTGNVLSLTSTSTAGDGSKLLNLSRSGTNGTAGKTNYGLYSTITNTGDTSTNVAAYLTASGGTSNYALIVPSTGGQIGIGTTTPIADYLVHVVADSTQDWSKAVYITQANNSAEDTTSLSLGSTAQPPTLSGVNRTMTGLDLTIAPAGSISVTNVGTLNMYGINNTVDDSGKVSFGTNSAVGNFASVYGVNTTITASPVYATTATAGDVYGAYGNSNVLTGAPDLTNVPTGSSYLTYGNYISNTVTSAGNANLTATSYGFYSAVGGDLTTNGTTTHYGGYFDSTGSADNNYGNYIDTVSGATNNYGLRINTVAAAAGNWAIYSNAAAQSYFAGNVGIGNDTTPDALLEISSADTDGGDFLITNTGTGTSGTVASIVSNATTTGDIFTLSATALTSGTALTLTGPTSTGVTDHFIKASADIGSAASLLNLNPDFSGSAVTGYGIYNLATDATANANTDYGYYGSLSLTGNANKVGYGIYQTITDTSTAGGTLYGADILVDPNGITGTNNKTIYGLRSQVTNDTATDTNAATIYGGYFAATGNTGGSGSTGTGIYATATGSDNNYAGIFDAGNVGIGTTAPSDFNLQITGHIGPTTDDLYDLGDNNQRWRDIYLGPASLHVGTAVGDEGTLSYTTSTNTLTLDNDSAGNIGIGTGALAQAITIGNDTLGTSLAFKSGTGAQTFTSKVVTGTTTTSAFVFDGGDLTTGTGTYFTSDSLTQGKLVQIAPTGNTLTTGTLLDLRTTATSLTGAAGVGSMLNLDWSPGSATTATGDLFALNIGTNGTTTGNLFNILDTSSSIFSVSETAMTTSLPANFTAPGDVSIAYDINFTNPTASYIKSAAPLYLVSGETFNSSDLTLQTYNTGNIVLQTTTTGYTLVPSGNVGIGTTGPSVALHVVSGTSPAAPFTSSATIVGAGGTARHGILGQTTDAGYWGGLVYNSSGTTTEVDLAGGTYAAIFKGGNVGIGTTSPGDKLHVDGGVIFGDSSTNATNVKFDFRPSYTGAAGDNWVSHFFGTWTGPTTASTVNWYASGSNPTLALVNSSGTNTYAGWYSYNPTVSSGTLTNNYGVRIGNMTAGTNNYSIYSEGGTMYHAGNVGIGTAAPSAPLNVYTTTTATHRIADFLSSSLTSGNYQITLFGHDTSGDGGGTLEWHHNTTAASRYFGIGINGQTTLLNITQPGNVGINTTAPAYKLEIVKTGTGIQNSASITNQQAAAADVGSRLLFVGVTDQAMAGVGSAWTAAATTNSYMTFYTRKSDVFTEQMRIDNNGNVGIGTTAPATLMQVGSSASSANQYLTIDAAAAQQSAIAFYSAGVQKSVIYRPASSNDLRIWTSVVGDTMTFLNSNGNVGINNTAPATKFEVTASGGETARFSGASTPYITIGNGLTSTSGGYIQWDDTNNLLNMSPHGITAMSINSGGNVGIGTTGPETALDVRGTTNVIQAREDGTGTSWRGRILSKNSSADKASFLGNYNSIAGVFAHNYALNAWADLYVNTVGGAGGMVVAGEGNVGIGTTDTTTYRLRVNGQPAANGYTAFTNYSDSRLKENVTYLDGDVLGKLNQLEPAQFNYNELTGYDQATRNRRITGLIAQNVKDVFPEMVGTANINGVDYYDTNLGPLQIYMLQGIKELSTNTAAAYKINADGDLEVPSLKVLASQGDALEPQYVNVGTLLADLDSRTSTASNAAALTAVLGEQTASNAASLQELESRITNHQSRIGMLESLTETLASQSALLQTLIGSSSASFVELDALSVENATVSGTLNVLGRSTFGDVGITGDLNIGVIAVDGLNGTLNTLADDLKIQSLGLGGVDILNGKVLIDTEGNILVQEKLTAKVIEAEEYKVKGSEGAGSATLLAGESSIEIQSSAANSHSRIFITATTVSNSQLVVSSKQNGKFKVETSIPTPANIKFDWLIVN